MFSVLGDICLKWLAWLSKLFVLRCFHVAKEILNFYSSLPPKLNELVLLHYPSNHPHPPSKGPISPIIPNLHPLFTKKFSLVKCSWLVVSNFSCLYFSMPKEVVCLHTCCDEHRKSMEESCTRNWR